MDIVSFCFEHIYFDFYNRFLNTELDYSEIEWIQDHIGSGTNENKIIGIGFSNLSRDECETLKYLYILEMFI
jgi:hypothetical protein